MDHVGSNHEDQTIHIPIASLERNLPEILTAIKRLRRSAEATGIGSQCFKRAMVTSQPVCGTAQ